MEGGSHIDQILARLQGAYGPSTQFGRSRRLFQFGNSLTCSINFSKELRGAKFFFGLSKEVLDAKFSIPATNYGHFVILVCGREEAVLWLNRKLVLSAMENVTSGKLDVFLEDERYILQTTGHPKLDVTEYLNDSPPINVSPAKTEDALPALGRSHSEIQLGLAKIGNAEGCKVWVPPSDRNLLWKDESLRDFTSDRLPNFGFDENTRKVVSNIDVLWLEGNIIRRAFEIEATTSIYSGLLRLNDLTLAQPNNLISLCIVSDEGRKPRVLGQLMRPTFRNLADRCSFLSFDHIRQSLSEVNRLKSRGITRVEGLLEAAFLQIPSRASLDPIDLQSL